MAKKKYNSFSEIDKDLKILQLKKEIAIWSAKNDYQRLQNSIAPKNLTFGALDNLRSKSLGASWKKVLGSFLVGYIIKRIIKR